jgi:hypothetical protein
MGALPMTRPCSADAHMVLRYLRRHQGTGPALRAAMTLRSRTPPRSQASDNPEAFRALYQLAAALAADAAELCHETTGLVLNAVEASSLSKPARRHESSLVACKKPAILAARPTITEVALGRRQCPIAPPPQGAHIYRGWGDPPIHGLHVHRPTLAVLGGACQHALFMGCNVGDVAKEI